MFETYNFSGEDNEKLQNEFVEKNFSSEDKQKYQTLVAKQQDWQEYGDVLGSSATVFGVTSVAALGVSKILKSKGVDTEEILEEIVNELYNSEYGKNDLAKFSTKVKEKKYSRTVQEDKFQM